MESGKGKPQNKKMCRIHKGRGQKNTKHNDISSMLKKLKTKNQ